MTGAEHIATILITALTSLENSKPEGRQLIFDAAEKQISKLSSAGHPTAAVGETINTLVAKTVWHV